ncbi:MAG: hypothetical protein JW822_11690 [Spirochaetales bacterium]|nr:hypothetical protein [Spirochaetales bacterium]
MKNTVSILLLIFYLCAGVWSCASIAPAEYVYTHLDELWGKTKEEIINLLPEDHLTYAEIGSAKLVLHEVHNLDYGNWVLIPGLKETVTYYFHNSRLYKIKIEIESNEFTDLKQKKELYNRYMQLIEEYTQRMGPADTSSHQAEEETQSGIDCARISHAWKPLKERALNALTSVILEFNCFTQPIELIRVRETFTHEHYKP